jgi:hypothetical protein
MEVGFEDAGGCIRRGGRNLTKMQMHEARQDCEVAGRCSKRWVSEEVRGILRIATSDMRRRRGIAKVKGVLIICIF